MGKNRDVKSLSRVIANVALHQLLVKHTNRPESQHHLESEVIEYRSTAMSKAAEHNWNEKDRERIRQNSLKELRKIIENNYPDVSFPNEELRRTLDNLIIEVLGEPK